MIQNVDKVLRKLPYGATEPIEGIINGENVIIKTFTNRWGYKILINEYVCLKMATILKLPIPNGGICNITMDTEISDDFEMDYDDDIYGIGFYSQRLPKVSKVVNNSEIFKMLKNKDDINKILLFDYLIYNTDRHKGNLLLSLDKKGPNIYIIDHSHVFNLQNKWNEENLSKLIEEEDYKDCEILESDSINIYRALVESKVITKFKLENIAGTFKKLINSDILDEIISELPKEWITNMNDIKQLKQYILYRFENIYNIVEIIDKRLLMSGGE